MTDENVTAGKSAAIISYILIIGVPIALSMNGEAKNSFAAFHIRQALGLSITFICLGLLVNNFDSWMISGPMYLFVSVLWSYAFITAIKGQTTPIPLLGNFFQKSLKGI